MSSTSTTTNYGLPIYGTNDIPKWDDTNTPFGNIDSALKGVVDDLTASDNLKFKFTKSGSSYGYLDVNGNFIPFKSPTGNKSITINSVGTTSGIDVSDYATVSVTTDGLSKPTGNKSITISSTGTTSNIDVANYATASVTTSGLSPTPSGTKYIYSNGSYDVTNYSSASVSVSASLNFNTTLWSNSSPNADFSSKTVSLNYSVINYSYLKFVFKKNASKSEYCYTIMSVSDFQNTGNSSGNACGGASWKNTSGNITFRGFSYAGSSSVYFSGAYSYSGQTLNGNLIPNAIYAA